MAVEDELFERLTEVFQRLRQMVQRLQDVAGVSRAKQERMLREAMRDWLREDPRANALRHRMDDRDFERRVAAEVDRVIEDRLGPENDPNDLDHDGIDDRRERDQRELEEIERTDLDHDGIDDHRERDQRELDGVDDQRERAESEEGEHDARAGDVIDAAVVDSSTEPLDRKRDEERDDREQDNGVPENVVPIAAGTGAAAAIGAEALIDEQRDDEAVDALSEQGQPGRIGEALDQGGDLRAQRDAAEQGPSRVEATLDPDGVSEARQQSFAETTQGQDVAPGIDPLDSEVDPSERAETEQLESSPQPAAQQEQVPARIGAAEERVAEQRSEEQRSEGQRSEGQRSEEQRSEEQRSEEQRSEEQRSEGQRSEEQRADGREVGEPNPEERSQAQAELDQPAVDQSASGAEQQPRATTLEEVRLDQEAVAESLDKGLARDDLRVEEEARAKADREAAGPQYEGGSAAEDGSRRIESTDLEGMNGGQPDYPDRDSAPQQPPDQDLDYEPEPASRNVVNEDRELDPSEGPQEAPDENLDNDQDSLAPPTAGDRHAQAGAENQAENQEEQPGQQVQEATGQYAGMSDEVQQLRDLTHGGQRPASEAATAPTGAPSAEPHAGVTAGRQHQRLRQGTEQAQDSANPERSIGGD
jgi:hypothetical protein